MNQVDLFAQDPVSQWQAMYDDGTYPTDFWEWLRSNEHILSAFIEIAVRAKNAGITRWGAFAVGNILRWETAMREGGQQAVKINNNAMPGLARLAMELCPGLRGLFSTRAPPAKCHARRLIDGGYYTDEGDE